jgi:hypothetical protein
MAVADPDRELLALCGRFMRMDNRLERLFELMREAEEAGDSARANRAWEVTRPIVPARNELLNQLLALPAQTSAGRSQKAKCALTQVAFENTGRPFDSDLPLWSLCRDLLGDADMREIRR